MDTIQIAKRVKELRIKKGYNQHQFALRAGISSTYIRDIEAGRKNPTVQCLSYLCDALDITLQQFFTEETSPENQDKLGQLTAHQQELLNEFLKSLLN